jgi:D-glycero-D-manno-heptose 1,7-bisphosphate phosphatase
MSGVPAIFLDRDGVLNRIVERDGVTASPRIPSELVIEDEAPGALAALKAAGYRLYAVTNQPDIARGLMARSDLDAIHEAVLRALPLDEISACTHDNADNCDCRKPKPGLILSLAARHGVDLSRSWMIGDQDRDIVSGKNAGVSTALLSRQYNSGEQSNADIVAPTLSQAVQAILAASEA